MDRNRFKRKTDDVPVTSPKPRPIMQAGEISAPQGRPVARPEARHHATPVRHAPTHRPSPVTKPLLTGEIQPPRPIHSQPTKIHAQAKPAAFKPAPTEPKAVAPLPEVEDIPELDNLESTIPSTVKPAETKKLSKRRIAEIALVAVFLVGGFMIFKPSSKQDLGKGSAAVSGLHISTNGAAANSTATVAGTVPFTPVVPVGKTQLAQLGSKAYNSEYKSYTFDDTYLSQKLRVSQQELPAGQDNAAGLIDKIGASLKAQSVTPVTIQSGQPAYILNNTNNAGAQVVVFTAKGKLIFIQAATAFDATIWPDYLNTFQ